LGFDIKALEEGALRESWIAADDGGVKIHHGQQDHIQLEELRRLGEQDVKLLIIESDAGHQEKKAPLE